MNIEEFIEKREFLYHLTDRRNFEIIRTNGILLSTKSIIARSNLSITDQQDFLRNKREEHSQIVIDNNSFHIRDQRPINIKNLIKTLTHGLSAYDFIEILNNRVFFWPTISRLSRHYERYSFENPIILKVATRSLISLNMNSEFCDINSGATRSHPKWNGGPPPRGLDTFLSHDRVNYSINKVAEVTFPDHCLLPRSIFISDTPFGPWGVANIN
jgi:hypothetical protein